MKITREDWNNLFWTTGHGRSSNFRRKEFVWLVLERWQSQSYSSGFIYEMASELPSTNQIGWRVCQSISFLLWSRLQIKWFDFYWWIFGIQKGSWISELPYPRYMHTSSCWHKWCGRESCSSSKWRDFVLRLPGRCPTQIVERSIPYLLYAA